MQKVPYVGTRVEGKNLASSGKHHPSLCFWYLGLHCFLGHATASQLGCIFGRYPGVITHTDRDMNYATIKYDDGEVEEAVLAKEVYSSRRSSSLSVPRGVASYPLRSLSELG